LQQARNGFLIVGHGTNISTGVSVQAGCLSIGERARHSFRLRHVSGRQSAGCYQQEENKNNEIEWERRGALTELISYMKTFLSQNLAGIRKATQVTMGQTEY
jgi:hypothetical protein